MKKVLFVVAMLMGCCNLWAAEYEYVPLVREGVEWNYKTHRATKSPEDNMEYYRVRFSGTTEYNGKSYSNVYRYRGCDFDKNSAHLIAYMREENKKVYVVPVAYDEFDANLEHYFNGKFYPFGKEIMTFDFSFEGGTWVGPELLDTYLPEPILETKTVEIGGKLRNEYVARSYSLIEGIGMVRNDENDIIYPFQPMITGLNYWITGLNYMRENGEVVYQSPIYDARDACTGGVAEVKSTDNIAIAIGGGNIEVRCADATCQAIEIVDLGGRLIKKKICDNESTTTISAKGIEKGVYILVVNTTKGISSRKIIL